MALPSMGRGVEEVELSGKSDHEIAAQQDTLNPIHTPDPLALEAVSIRDVIEGNLTSYCTIDARIADKLERVGCNTDNTHNTGSIWFQNHEDKFSIWFKTWLHNKKTNRIHVVMAMCFMLLTYFEKPTNSNAFGNTETEILADVMSWMFTTYFLVIFCIM